MNHFERLGVAPSPSLDADDLERRYLLESREVHPDLNADEESALVESAALNEAYRTLQDPWTRYAYLAELYAAGVMVQTKQLDPMFLAEAMELFEEAQEARASEESRRTLEQRVADELAALQQRIETLLASEAGARDAAVLCHQARYLQRTLETLDASDHPTIP